jgi:hypothetical protein
MEQRICFYLGNLTKGEYGDKITINNLGNNSKNENEKINYEITLKNLLIKLGYKDRNFYAVFGDIQHRINPLTLCKNRCSDSKDGVILRCLNFERHWKNYYNKPKDILFNQKLNICFWRGTTTGSEDRLANRFDLVKKWFNKRPDLDIGFSFICQGKDNYKQYVKGNVPITYFLKYKYIISVEGNDKDSGLNWKLNSNSLVLMPRPRIESWLMETTLIPNYHYILLNDDFTDLAEKIEWCNANQNKCKEIITNANNFMKQFANQKVEEDIQTEVLKRYFN